MDADIRNAGILDAHLDSILTLAFMYEDLLLANEAEEESKRDYSVTEITVFQETFALTKTKYIETCKRVSHEIHNRIIRKTISKMGKIGAAILLMISLLAPIAIANVEYIRVRVMKLLISIQEDHTEISLREDVALSYDVPAKWEGNYYPSYIPDGYKISSLQTVFWSVEYVNNEDRYITFEEYTEEWEISADSENAQITYTQINGNIAMIIEKERYQVIWSNGEHYFVVAADDIEVAKKVANSVRRIT